LVYNIRDISNDPSNERDRERKEKETQMNESKVLGYDNEILGNTEVEGIGQNNPRFASPRLNELIQNPTQNDIQNVTQVQSIRPNQETGAPNNEMSTFINNLEAQINNIQQLNTENNENNDSQNLMLTSRDNNYERMATERATDLLNSGIPLNGSNIFPNTLEK
jgi:hypothetical protein